MPPVVAAGAVGVALSGGGITACVCALCLLRALETEVGMGPDVIVSTVSGGTLGVLLYENAPAFRPLSYPVVDPKAATYESLSSTAAGDEGETWFANIVRYVPSWPPRPPIRGREGRELAALPDLSGWWEGALDEAAKLAYGMDASSLRSGDRPWVAGAALLEAHAIPIDRDGDGVFTGARERLHAVEIDMASMRTTTPGLSEVNASLPESAGRLWAAAWSSAFWAAPLVESELQYDLFGSALSRYDSDAGSVVALDGGMVDTTGVPALLRRRVASIVLFYDNNNGGLLTQPAALSFLFGVNEPTDSMNVVEGAGLAQVFDAALWPAALRNLTSGPRIATFESVTVEENAYLGVGAYVLDSLVVIGLERDEGFLAAFEDPAVAAHVPGDWPNDIPVSMDPFAANLLCAHAHYRVASHAAALKRALT